MQDRKIELLDFVLQPDNSGQLSLLLIENLKKLRENLRHDIIPEHFDETDFSYDISNKTNE
jgi:hypothetical protein